ncbi:YwmB family TATA-box binding protein [Paenibacillus agricola]
MINIKIQELSAFRIFRLKFVLPLNQGEKMNLQLAIHKNSVTDQWRVTIGTPIITIEY